MTQVVVRYRAEADIEKAKAWYASDAVLHQHQRPGGWKPRMKFEGTG